MITSSSSYATRAVTLTILVSTGRQETFTDVNSKTFISFFKQPVAARKKGGGRRPYISTWKGINFDPIAKPFEIIVNVFIL